MTIFTREGGPESKFVHVDRWDEEIEIAQELLDHSDPTFLKVLGDRLIFNVQNGYAVYRLGAPDRFGNRRATLLAGRVQKEWVA
jgi:hypothetical protein